MLNGASEYFDEHPMPIVPKKEILKIDKKEIAENFIVDPEIETIISSYLDSMKKVVFSTKDQVRRKSAFITATIESKDFNFKDGILEEPKDGKSDGTRMREYLKPYINSNPPVSLEALTQPEKNRWEATLLLKEADSLMKDVYEE